MPAELQSTPRFDGYYRTPLQFKPYRYSLLQSPTSIRLVSFVRLEDCVRGISFDGAPLLELTLKSVDLNSNPDFKCLSYTWGNWETKSACEYDGYTTTAKQPIIIDGQLLYITRNLHDALWQFGPWGQWHPDRRFKPFNQTELIRAAEAGQSRVVQQLIEKGADLNLQDMFGRTALHYAAENGNLTVVNILLRHGAWVRMTDDQRLSPIDCCRQYKRGQWSKVVHALASYSQSTHPASARIGVLFPLKTQLWVDAICIDQQNPAERAFQVTLMSRIYSDARSVLVWLGIADCSVQTSWEYMTYSFSEATETICKRLPRGVRNAQGHFTDCSALGKLFGRRWFYRRWVIQEMALAQRLEVFCGPYEFDWHRITSAVFDSNFVIKDHPSLCATNWLDSPQYLQDWHSTRPFTTLVYVRLRTRPESHPNSAQIIERSNFVPLSSKFSLQELLILCWHFDVSDPRDRIYALLGIAEAFESLSLAKPDYFRSVSDLYTEIGQIFIRASGLPRVSNSRTGTENGFEPLEGLSFVQGTSCGKHIFDPWDTSCELVAQNHRLPSWVPDFNARLSTTRIHRPKFRASAGSEAKLYPSDPHLIKLDACWVDSIVDAENDPVQSKPRGNEPRRYHDSLSWLKMMAKFDVVSPSGQNRAEVLWRTLMIDEVPDVERAKSSFRMFICKDFADAKRNVWKRKKYMDLLKDLCETDDSGSLPSIAQLVEFRDTFQPSKHGSSDCSEFDEKSFPYKLAEIVRKRGLLKTQNGLMGFGPRWTRPGDEVWLLSGARTPFILRRLPNHSIYDRYRMIGEAYVHGLMYGEAFTDQPPQFHQIEIY